MDAGDACIIFAFCSVLSLIPFGFLLDDFGETSVTGTVVATQYSDFPFHSTDVTFVYSVPNGTILEKTFVRTYEGRLNLQSGLCYRITATKSFGHLYGSVDKIELLSELDYGGELVWQNKTV